MWGPQVRYVCCFTFKPQKLVRYEYHKLKLLELETNLAIQGWPHCKINFKLKGKDLNCVCEVVAEVHRGIARIFCSNFLIEVPPFLRHLELSLCKFSLYYLIQQFPYGL